MSTRLGAGRGGGRARRRDAPAHGSLQRNRDERARCARCAAARAALRVIRRRPISCWSNSARHAAPIEAALLARGVVLRPMAGYGLAECLRITVGTAARTRACSQALDEDRHERATVRTGLDRVARTSRCAAALAMCPGDKSVSHRAIMLGRARRWRLAHRRLPGRRGHARDRRDLRAARRAHRSAVPRRAHRAWRRRRRPAGADGAAGLRQCRHRHAPAGRAARGAALRQRAGRRRHRCRGGRCAASSTRLSRMGARIDCRSGRLAAAAHHGRAARLQAIDFQPEGRQRAGQVGGPAGRPVRAAARPSCANRSRPATTPSACWPRSAGRSNSNPAWRACRAGTACAPTDVRVPADFSSAAFFIVAATLVPGSAADAARGRHQSAPHRPAARAARDGRGHRRRRTAASRAASRSRICVVRHAPLRGIEVPDAHVAGHDRRVPGAVRRRGLRAAARTVIRGAAELRVKESDRIGTMAAGLRALGIDVDETRGRRHDPRRPHAAPQRSTATAITASRWRSRSRRRSPKVRCAIRDVANVATSFPRFRSSWRGRPDSACARLNCSASESSLTALRLLARSSLNSTGTCTVDATALPFLIAGSKRHLRTASLRGAVEIARTAAPGDFDVGGIAAGIDVGADQHRAFLAGAERRSRILGLDLGDWPRVAIGHRWLAAWRVSRLPCAWRARARHCVSGPGVIASVVRRWQSSRQAA